MDILALGECVARTIATLHERARGDLDRRAIKVYVTVDGVDHAIENVRIGWGYTDADASDLLDGPPTPDVYLET